MFSRIRLCLRKLCTVSAVCLLLPSSAANAQRMITIFAQAEGGTVVIESSRNYTFDVLIVLALFGGALYAICRSSRRT